MKEESKKVDEVIIRKDFNLDEAISSLRFYWNLARREGRVLIMELWRDKEPLEDGG